MVFLLMVFESEVATFEEGISKSQIPPDYIDTCQYSEGYHNCGDQCIFWDSICECGNSSIRIDIRNDEYCCNMHSKGHFS